MTTRTTLESLMSTSILNMQLSSSRFQKLQEQIATGKRVNRPSDDPADTGKILSLRSEGIRLDTFSSNIETGIQTLSFSTSTLRGAADLVQRVQQLTVQGVNDTMDQNGRDAIAAEINQVLESLLQIANTTRAGKYIYAGTETTTRAFTETRNSSGDISAVAYNGNREKIDYQIGPGINVQVNQPGEEVFVDNGLFNTIIRIRDSLRNGALSYVRDELGNIDVQQNDILGIISKMGGVTSTLLLTSNRIEDTKLSINELQASAESADFAELVLNLKEEETVFQAALASSSLIFRTSILDYL